METAPKNKPVLLDVGLTWPVYGIWNKPSGYWVYSNLQASLNNSKWTDTYFENETVETPNGWIELLQIKRD